MLRAAGHADAAARENGEGGSLGGMGFGPSESGGNQGMGSPYGGGPMGPLRVETQRRVGVLVLLITTLMAGLFLSTTCPSGRSRRVVYTNAISAAPAAGPSRTASVGNTDDGASWAPFVRVARVIEPGSPAAVGEGAMCAIEVTPVDSGPFDCRVVVRCDDHVLYGEVPDSGFNFCGPVPSRIVDGNVSRDDGDPRLEIDLASGSVVIEERLGLGVQRVELEIVD